MNTIGNPVIIGKSEYTSGGSIFSNTTETTIDTKGLLRSLGAKNLAQAYDDLARYLANQDKKQYLVPAAITTSVIVGSALSKGGATGASIGAASLGDASTAFFPILIPKAIFDIALRDPNEPISFGNYSNVDEKGNISC